MNIRLLQIAFGAGLLWYTVLRGAKALQVKLHSYEFRNLSLTEQTVSLYLNLSIKNPLLVGLTVKGVQGNVFAQGKQVGTVNTVYDYYLSGGKTHILPVVVNLSMADVGAAALLNIQSGDVRTLTVAFDGKIYVGEKSIGVPVKIELDYNDLVK